MKKLFMTAALCGTFVSIQAGAQPNAAPAEGNLTRQDAISRADALFQKLDLDHDGILTLDEAMRAGQQLRAEGAATGQDVAPGIGGHTSRYLKRVFADAQSVTRERFEQAMLAHFEQMDTDHDGILTPNERQAGTSKP